MLVPARLTLLIAGLVLLSAPTALAQPEETIRLSSDILKLSMARQVPASLLAEAHGVAIIPDVIKLGFVAAVRRGHGVVMVKDANGQWTLPTFVTLTGGSVGWQAGIQNTDVVLVFTTKKSVDGLMSGKFTIGADASAAAGPVGRNAAAATDARLKAEILSYSRSRGLFAGVSLDGSAIEVNQVAATEFYGAPPGQPPVRVPESALRLVQELVQATQTTVDPLAEAGPMPGVPTPAAPGTAQPTGRAIKPQLARSSQALYALLDDPWKKFLALPPQVFEGNEPPPLDKLQSSLSQFDKVAQSPKYENLATRNEFQTTYAYLREYVEQLAQSGRETLSLPPPPAQP